MSKATLALAVLATAVSIPGQAIAARVRAPEAPPGYPSTERYAVSLVPEAATGSFGWRVAYEAFGAREYGESYLPQDLAEPVLTGAGLGGVSGASSSRFDRRILLTSASVASVSIDGGPRIPTAPVVGLPFEIRSVLYDIPGVSPSELRRGAFSVRVRAFDANGQPVVYAPPPIPPKLEPKPVLETRTWQLPAPAALGVCDMWPDRLQGVSGLTERAGTVVSDLRPVMGLVGQPLISCANTEFAHLQEWSLESFMLLDLEHPGATPAAIPGMTPLAGRPGVYQSLLRGEALVARRVPGAWLLVKGGPDLHERLRLLTHLRGAVHLKSRPVHRRTRRSRLHRALD